MNPLPRKKLPIGIQTFSTLREGGYYYADKSGYAVDLYERGRYYFLSRPRRFGKSLFLDTLKDLFEGRKELFEGLQGEKRWDWGKNHPVIWISLGGGILKSKEELNERIGEILQDNQERLGICCTRTSIGGKFEELIMKAHKKMGKPAVVLIDEYDKPILDNITDREIATDMREGLKNLYSVLKGADAHLRFTFITGVSKFSKVSLFSGLNHLQDITLDERYSAICGYTNADVDSVFAPELFGLDREKIRQWYNGYNWLGEGVYNPFDLLLLFDKRQFANYWFETGTPTFLIEVIQERKPFTPELDQLVTTEGLISTFDVGNIPMEALLFQAGYLTIDRIEYIMEMREVILRYPNQEVRMSMNALLLQTLTNTGAQYVHNVKKLYNAMLKNDFDALKLAFQQFFSSIPYNWYTQNPIAQYEGYYASIFYSHFAALGMDVHAEDVTNHGRMDMVVFFNGQVYIFEFKVEELTPKGKALAQIKERNYADKYRNRNEPIHLIGVEFSKVNRNIIALDVETIPNTP